MPLSGGYYYPQFSPTGKSGDPNNLMAITDGQHIANIDSSNALVEMVHTHNKIHKGLFFACGGEGNGISNGNAKLWLIKTPLSTSAILPYAHFGYSVECDAQSSVRFYEGPTVTNTGSALNIYNCNRVSAFTSSLLIYESASVSASGTLLSSHRVGSAGGPAKSENGGNTDQTVIEWILQPNTYYLLQTRAEATTVNFSVTFTHYMGGTDSLN